MSEQKLRETEESYRELYENAPNAYLSVGIDRIIKDCNKAAVKLLGYTKEELMKMKLLDMYYNSPDGKDKAKVMFQRFLKGERIQDEELQIKQKNGTPIWISLTVSPVRNLSGQLIETRSMIIDVDKRRKAEEKISGIAKFPSENPNPILRVDKEHILYSNKPAENLFKIVENDNLPSIIQEIVHKVIDTGISRITEIGVNNLTYSLDITPIKEEGYANIYGRDITEWKKLEENLRMNEELFRDFFENAAIGFHIFSPDRMIVGMNKYELDLLGYTREEIVDKKTYYDLIIPEQINQFEKHWDEILNIGFVNNLEYTLIHKDGHFINVLLNASAKFDRNGNLINTRGSIIDITVRGQAEQALRESKHNLGERVKELTCLYGLSKLFEKPDISIDEIFKGTLVLIPPAWQFPEVTCARINFDIKEFQTSNFKETKWKLFSRVILSEKVMEIEVYYLEDKPFLKEEEHLIYEIAQRLRVIIERKETEQELINTLENTKKLNRELQEFVYVASHDLQEPLRMVISFTQLIAKKLEDKLDDDTKEFINYAVDGATRMKNLINDLLSYSRVTTRGETFKKVNIKKVLEEVILNLQIKIKETGAKITYGEFPSLLADRTQILQLFQNLISNAIKFRSKENPLIHISVKRANQELIFSVEDNGIGIEKRFFDKIFIIFQRLHTRNEYPGTGIGLAICKKIIERLDGRIWVVSEVGKGTIFKFVIPIRK
ncbi:hypothetical protein LCGC14_0721050 [marine sediment metagenome]|uniref:histidine kinase n=1 Tax=marine sediment metagenome TaxID=412755 RepID=A0A0F9QGJ4_9ZZZZ